MYLFCCLSSYNNEHNGVEMYHMKKFLVLFILLFLINIQHAYSQLEFEKGKDPITDENFGLLSVDSTDNRIGLAFKCWNDRSRTHWIALILNIDFGSASKYPNSIDVNVRIDDYKPYPIRFNQINIANKLSYITRADIDNDFDDLVTAIFKSNNSIAITFINTNYKFDVSKSNNAKQQMIKTCPYL